MSCPSCSHTMHRLSNEPVYFWCPRCGTIRRVTAESDPPDIGVPALIERVRACHECLPAEGKKAFHILGITEAITP